MCDFEINLPPSSLASETTPNRRLSDFVVASVLSNFEASSSVPQANFPRHTASRQPKALPEFIRAMTTIDVLA